MGAKSGNTGAWTNGRPSQPIKQTYACCETVVPAAMVHNPITSSMKHW